MITHLTAAGSSEKDAVSRIFHKYLQVSEKHTELSSTLIIGLYIHLYESITSHRNFEAEQQTES